MSGLSSQPYNQANAHTPKSTRRIWHLSTHSASGKSNSLGGPFKRGKFWNLRAIYRFVGFSFDGLPHENPQYSPETVTPRLNLSLFCVCLALLVACQPVPTTDRASPTADAQTYFQISIGEQPLKLQLALSQNEQRRGLMFRQQLEPDAGMLFLFERPKRRAFWMRNTSLPLDIGYFDADGRLLEVHKLFPYDENEVVSRSDQVLIAVETNRGWFKANCVSPGHKIDMAALRAALKRRGVSNPSLSQD